MYLKEKTNEFNDRTLSLDGERVITALEEIVGERNPALVDLTVDDGYAFRDYWLNKGNSPDMARRRLNTINAIVNLSIRRHDIRNFNNPFSKIETKGAGKGAKHKRVALSVGEIRQLQPFVDRLEDKDARDIWMLMVFTGARPGELATLVRDDLSLDGSIPYLFIRANSIWRVKTDSADRRVPLLGDALTIVERRATSLAKAGPNEPVFRRYGKARGADLLSKNLTNMMKRSGVYEPRRKVPYSLRHAHKDWLRRVAPEDRVDLIHGHSNGSIARNYGSDHMLDLLQADIEKALTTAGVLPVQRE